MKIRNNSQTKPFLFAPYGAFLNISGLSGLSRQALKSIYYWGTHSIFHVLPDSDKKIPRGIAPWGISDIVV